jgi:hypothetical protein
MWGTVQWRRWTIAIWHIAIPCNWLFAYRQLIDCCYTPIKIFVSFIWLIFCSVKFLLVNLSTTLWRYNCEWKYISVHSWPQVKTDVIASGSEFFLPEEVSPRPIQRTLCRFQRQSVCCG